MFKYQLFQHRYNNNLKFIILNIKELEKKLKVRKLLLMIYLIKVP